MVAEIVKLPIREPDASIVEFLEDLIQQVKSGDVTSFLCIRFHKDGNFAVSQAGKGSALELAGALSFALNDVINANPPK